MISGLKNFFHAIVTWSRSVPALSPRMLAVCLLLCCMLALGLRLCKLYAEPVLSRDGLGYVMWAQEIQAHRNAAEEMRPSPHYFYAKYLSSRLFFMSPHRLGVATNIVLGTLLPLLFFAIAKLIFDDGEIALCCALLAAVHPQLVDYSIAVQRETPYMFFCGGFFIFAILFCRSRKWFWSVGMAFCAVLGLCFRYEGAELFLFAWAVYLVCFWRDRNRSWHGLIAPGIFSVLFFGLLWIVFAAMDISLTDAFAGAGKKLGTYGRRFF